jgi:RNA polymerase sigma factor (sigma-70 family)
LFRRQAGRLISALTRVLGVQRIDLAEDIIQESLLAALQAWKLGLPRDPEAWLFAVARNRARDVLRRERVRGGAEIAGDELEALKAPDPVDEHTDLLRLMFSCCHPALSEDGQIALILRLVCGFGPREVAHAFLVEPSAMEKRLVRAKRVLADDGRLVEVSTAAQARERLPAVLSAIYLMFDAGYHGSLSPQPIRAEICADAIHLGRILVAARATSRPDVHALLALMCLHAARMPARVDADGSLVPLERQDRSRWDAELVGCGMQHLSASARRRVLTAYHLEAGIAAQHAVAPSVEKTRWDEVSTISCMRVNAPLWWRSDGRSRAHRSLRRTQASTSCDRLRGASGSNRIPSSGRRLVTWRYAPGSHRGRAPGSSVVQRQRGTMPNRGYFSADSRSVALSTT